MALPARVTTTGQSERPRILVVEDERKIAGAIAEGLDAEGFDVIVEHTGQGAFVRGTTGSIDLILLDMGLPDRDGLEVLRAWRRLNVNTPVVVLTGRDAVSERIAGLDAGADDYIVKPFAFAEVLSRCRAVLRRPGLQPGRPLEAGGVTLDVMTRCVERDGRRIELSKREFDLLAHLLGHCGEVVPRETLAREVWCEQMRSVTLDNVIDVHIARLRRKLGADENAGDSIIQTVRGVGFVIERSGGS